jgi:hypothetical protein
MPESQQLIHFIVPTIIATVLSLIIAYRVRSKPIVQSIVVCVGLLIGFAAGQIWNEGFAFPPEREWHAVVFIGCIGALLTIAFGWTSAKNPTVPMVLAAVSCTAVWYLVPIGSDSIFDEHRWLWIGLIGIATFANAYLFRVCIRHSGHRFLLWVVVAYWGLISAGVLMNYATLGAATLAYWTAAIAFAIAACFGKSEPIDAKSQNVQWKADVGCVLIFIGSLMTICYRVYNYGMPAAWTNLFFLYLPAVVFAIDRFAVNKKSTRVRLAVAAATSTVMCLIPIIALATASGGEDW